MMFSCHSIFKADKHFCIIYVGVMARQSIPYRIKAQLQKEINSECPVCGNTDVACFEFHHIDENPANGVPENILMLCPGCHTKYHKGFITRNQIKQAKTNSLTIKREIEYVSVSVNGKCGWHQNEANEHSFFDMNFTKKSAHPILVFAFINNLSKTVILHKIEIEVNHLSKGISGFGPEPSVLKSLARYRLRITHGNKRCRFTLPNPISVPAGQAFMFETELVESAGVNQSVYILDGRVVTNWAFILAIVELYEYLPYTLTA